MGIRVSLRHRTSYRFDRPTTILPHVVRLRPAPHTRTPIVSYSLTVLPAKHFINWQQDPFGNYLARCVFIDPARELSFDVDLVADMVVINPFDFFVDESAQRSPFEYDKKLAHDLAPYLVKEPAGPHLTEWLASVDRTERETNDFLVSINQRLSQDIGYIIRLEAGVQACELTLSSGKGSCRDSAWLLTQIFRHLGLAARFVSGYIIQLVADVPPIEGPAGPSTDFCDLHAWTEVFVPGAGWIGLDATSGLLTGEGHIPLAATPEPSTAAPITGATSVCEAELDFQMTVQRLVDAPRSTKPFSEEQWRRIQGVGRSVESALKRGDVRLTIGGEPTFVGIDHPDSPEWNIAALGENKRRCAGVLLRRLRDRFAPTAALHFGQGKWYPGEELPRWALSLFWRKDGEPVWTDPALIAGDDEPTAANIELAQQFIETLADRLRVGAARTIPTYEDAFYYLWKESNLPVNVDPYKVDLKDPLERRRLQRLLDDGLDGPVGYVLPLRWSWAYDGWQSGPWPLRRERLYLAPGDSPIGLRLPLDSLPHIEPKDREIFLDPSPLDPKPPLPGFAFARTPRRTEENAPDKSEQEPRFEQTPGRAAEADESIRTSLCVEPRGGRLYVFLPPLTELEHYIELVTHIEATAAQLQTPVLMEGYPPPFDPRLERLSVTPDPGVIEVNVPPAADWDGLQSIVHGVYEEARLSRLAAEKFLVDGRHTGSGGGFHLTMGAAKPIDSPFLRRPDMLRSLTNFWQNHPCLSFFFTGAFIGPTSQTPRVDEARNDSLYELEIAYAEVEQARNPPPWLVDRIFRHLLVDITGNTHRTEFSIDKLYSPDSRSGRLGLVELRPFEMPPHPRMALLQTLMVQALVAKFWNEPYQRPLVRWGAEIHDRWMLPHYLWRDLGDVVDVLRSADFAFEHEWFEAFLDFRFPSMGKRQIQDLTLELRHAIEPWHVLGEEVASSGTARYVDSSVERLQLKVTGMTELRHAVVCNGRRVPLRPTGVRGEFVAGVRFRAWAPPSALHPTIGIHAPLVFDVLDLWNGRSIGGCTYHVAHPGGRSSDDSPVNAAAAEGRRIARFWPHGHTPGALSAPAEEINSELPYTLDLRRPAKF